MDTQKRLAEIRERIERGSSWVGLTEDFVWLLDLNEKQERAISEMREALVEYALPPYKDSDLKSLYMWVNARAVNALARVDAILKGEGE